MWDGGDESVEVWQQKANLENEALPLAAFQGGQWLFRSYSGSV